MYEIYKQDQLSQLINVGRIFLEDTPKTWSPVLNLYLTSSAQNQTLSLGTQSNSIALGRIRNQSQNKKKC